ncbi:MAG: two-component regulator propeller domain-containing protein [Bacteroidota bacterium]|nr:two-component regulator propeller domain-containing protein [Bacteroidota bacterium]MDP4234400.1 two-component regulator propeller domain-containing protein [Bacteroidota bacterium]
MIGMLVQVQLAASRWSGHPWWFVLLAFVVFSLDTSQTSAQENTRSFRHLGTADGLSEGRITCMLQDSKGFIWIGTFHGLNKYDGYSFKQYYALPHHPEGLQSNVITALCEDSSHTIWVGTRDGGLYSLDRRTDRVQRYTHNSNNQNSLSSNDISAILCDSKRRLWVATYGDGLYYFDRTSGSFTRYPYLPAMVLMSHAADPRDVRIFETDSGNILINRPGVLMEFNTKTELSRLVSDASATVWPLRKGEGYLFLERGAHERLILHASRSLIEFRLTAGWGMSNQNPTFILPDEFESNGTTNRTSYILGTSRGLYIFDVANHSIEPFQTGLLEPVNSYDNVFTCGLWDRQGRLWIGSFNGLYALNKDALVFKKHRLQSGMNQGRTMRASVAPQTIRSLYVDHQGSLFAGTLSGQLFAWSARDHEFHLEGRPSVFQGPNPINCIVQDFARNTWFGVTAGPFFVRAAGHHALFSLTDHRTPRNLQISSSFHPRSGRGVLPPATCGYVVYCDRKGQLWFGSGVPMDKNAATLHSYDPRSGAWVSYSYPGSEVGHNGLHGVYAILEDHLNDLWIGTAEGLFRLDRTTRRFTSFTYDPADEYSLNSNSCSTLFEDSRGRLWIGSWGGGLDLFDRESGRFRHFTEKDGLSSNIIYSMLEDKAGTLWIATGRGISHFNPDLRTFSNYDIDDGLLDNEYQPSAAAMLPTGEMFFGGNHGVTSFFPERLAHKAPKAPLAITSFNAAYSPVASELVDGDTITLAYDQNDLSFEFASLDFASAAKERYAYMMDGVDHDWVQCGSRNSGSYNNLPPGHYLLRINSANAQGFWDARGIGINVFIATPYWESWWFELLVGFTSIALVLAWVQRHRTLERANQHMIDRALEQERVNIAGELHDGPLQDLYATRFLLEGVAANESDEIRHETLGTLLKKVRGELRAVTGELQLPRFEQGLVQELAQFIESFEEQNPHLKIATEMRPEPNQLPLIAQQNLFRIFRTALANVKKHAEASEVRVRFAGEGTGCTLEIIDDGRGFDVSSTFKAIGSGKRYGLILMQAYANEIRARLQITSTRGKGTRICVTYLRRKPFWNRYVLNRKA